MVRTARPKAIGLAVFFLSAFPCDAQWIRVVDRLPGTAGSVVIADVSYDGRALIGSGTAVARGVGAIRWTPETGTVALGFLPDSDRSYGTAMSGDGRVMFGTSTNPLINFQTAVPFRWTPQTGMSIFGNNTQQPIAASMDGSVVVLAGYSAVRWTAARGFESLGSLKEGTFSVPWDISGDGLVIVGHGNAPSTTQMAFRWAAGTGMVALGTLPNHTRSIAYSTNGDGTIAAGISGSSNSSGVSPRVVRWSADGSIEDLGPVPLAPAGFGSSRVGMSSNSEIVVVNGVWTRQGGWAEASAYLAAHGVNLSGWDSMSVENVSGDGRTFVGVGVYQGVRSVWIASVADRCDFDFDGDGLLTPTDLLGFVQGWIEGNAVADFDNDGSVEATDLFGWMNGWFAGCR